MYNFTQFEIGYFASGLNYMSARILRD